MQTKTSERQAYRILKVILLRVNPLIDVTEVVGRTFPNRSSLMQIHNATKQSKIMFYKTTITNQQATPPYANALIGRGVISDYFCQIPHKGHDAKKISKTYLKIALSVTSH